MSYQNLQASDLLDQLLEGQPNAYFQPLQTDSSFFFKDTKTSPLPSQYDQYAIPQYLLKQSNLDKNSAQSMYFTKDHHFHNQSQEEPIKTEVARNLNFDDAPVGKSNAAMNEMMVSHQEQNTDNMSVEEKIKAKNVKVRMVGFDNLYQIIISKNVQKYKDLEHCLSFSKFLKESNPGCFQKTVNCYREGVLIGWMSPSSQEIKQIIQNAFASGKPNIKKSALDLLEFSYQQHSQGVIEIIILEGLKSKNAKSLSAYINVVAELLGTYGIKKLNYLKSYYGEIVNILNNQKSNVVKTDALNLLKEAIKWIGFDFVQQYCQSLKQSSKKELERFWEAHDKIPMVPKKGASEPSLGTNQVEKKETINMYDIVDEVDVLRRFPQKWVDQVLNTSNWKEKAALLQQIVDACNTPKIAMSEFRHILQMSKRLLNDSNQAVVILSLKLLRNLSKGLRKNFSSAARSVMSMVLIKFREKKTQLIEEVVLCLDALLLSVSIEQIVEDIREALNDRNPQLKHQLLEWIIKVIEKAVSEGKQKSLSTERQKQGYRSIQLIVQKLNNDGTSQVREAAKRALQLFCDLFDREHQPSQMKSQSKIQPPSQSISRNQSRNNSKEKRKSVEKQKESKPKNNVSVISNTSTYKSKQEPSENSMFISHASGLKVDISTEIAKIMGHLNETDWQKRKSSLDELESVLDRYPNISSNGIHDLLMALKTRINDANKQLARQAIALVAKIIQSLGKQSKMQARLVIPTLIDVLADKNQSIRRQSINSLSQIRNIVGMDVVLHPMSLCLQNEKFELKMQILKFFLSNQEHLAFSKEFVKGVIYCFCDKNKQIRSLAERVFDKSWEIVGLSVYKAASKDKPSFAKEFNDLFSKVEKKSNTKMSRNNSGDILSPHEFGSRIISPHHQSKFLPPSSKKTQGLNRTMIETNKSSANDSNIISIREEYEGGDYFAPLKTLAANRIQRLSSDQGKRFNISKGLDFNIPELMEIMKQNIRKDLANRMMSLDYQQTIEAGAMISRMCKDLSHQTALREISDILIKWVLIRLWGGNSSMSSLFQIVPQLLAILQKKSILVNQYQVQLILSIVRQYFVSVDVVSRELIDLVIRCLLKVNTGEKVTKYLLSHFSGDISNYHSHIKKDLNYKYRQFLAGLIKTYLMEHLDNQEILTEIVKIKELTSNEEFINKLYSMFNEGWLNEYGFRKIHSEQPSIMSNRSVHSITTFEKKVDKRETIVQNKDRSVSKNERIKNIGSTRKLDSDLNISVRSLSKTPKAATKIDNVLDSKKRVVTPTNLKSPPPKIVPNYELPIHTYASPNKMNPIYEHLHNLCPASQSASSFFETLFIQTSDKISNQLEMYSKIIVSSIFNGLMHVFEHRNEVHPQKIIQQIVLLQQAVKNKHIISNCMDLIYTICDYILNQLVQQDQNKFTVIQKLKSRNIQFNAEKIGKMLNVCMLRVLEFAEPNHLLLILFKLLTKSLKTRFTSSPRLPSLILKCVYKMTQNFLSKIQESMIPALFQQFYSYNLVVTEINIQKDEGSVRILDIITGIAQKLNQNVWNAYDRSNLPHDNFINKHLKTLNVGKDKPKDTSNTYNDELKKITMMLSKSKTYQTGIILLSTFLDKHPQFQITQYYLQQEYDHKFIARVLASLESREKRVLRRDVSQEQTSIGSSYLDSKDNSNLMNKIRSLKQKREDNEEVYDRSNVRSRDKYSPRQLMKANDIKKKITEMGYKMGNAMK